MLHLHLLQDGRAIVRWWKGRIEGKGGRGVARILSWEQIHLGQSHPSMTSAE